MERLNGREKDLETMGVLAAACLAVFLVFKVAAFVPLALAFLVLGLFFRRAAARVSGLWLGFARVIGDFNSRVILGALYFLVLTPLSLLARFFGAIPVKTAFDRGADTYFERRSRTFGPPDFKNTW